MSDEHLDIDRLVAVHKSAGILVDANLLLMYLVGLSDITWITTFGRTREYRPEDFEILATLLARFDRIMTTPNVLTEVGNLANKLKGDRKDRFLNVLKNRIKAFDERYLASAEACEHGYFMKCGLTDAAILLAASNKILVLTDDFPLYGIMIHLGLACINFNNVRHWTS
jgi:hypothetical protein